MPEDSPAVGRPAGPAGKSTVNTTAQPEWLRTGYRFFPYAARQSGQWWVLRFNTGFPEHDMYTLFVDGRAVADVTGSLKSTSPLIAGIAHLHPFDPTLSEPELEAATAAAVVGAVARYVEYGSEVGDPCIFCSDGRDGMTRISAAG